MKPRRDITLGEMQDECKFRGDNCETVGGDRCKFFEVCATMQTIEKGCLTPIMWNLTDPPRFTEAQMAFWRGWYGIGATRAWRSDANNSRQCVHVHDAEDKYLGYLQIEYDALPIRCGETLDLAELLGKDGESK